MRRAHNRMSGGLSQAIPVYEIRTRGGSFEQTSPTVRHGAGRLGELACCVSENSALASRRMKLKAPFKLPMIVGCYTLSRMIGQSRVLVNRSSKFEIRRKRDDATLALAA
jgi:hypothetical protein